MYTFTEGRWIIETIAVDTTIIISLDGFTTDTM